MAKRLNTTYWSGQQLKADATFPAQGDMSYGSGYCDCSNISCNSIASFFGVSSSVGTICQLDGSFTSGGQSGHINAWARYKPGYVDYVTALPSNCYDSPTFEYHKPSPSSLGAFAGYNHYETTVPTYWSGAPSYNYGEIIEGSTHNIRGGLSRGKMVPVLAGANSEDEYYWSHVKTQVYKKISGGSYSLINTSAFVELNGDQGEDAAFYIALGQNGESAGNTYYVCLRPVYMDTDNTTPLAVIEDGPKEFYYSVITYADWLQDNGCYITDNSSYTSHSAPYTIVHPDFYIYNNTGDNINIDVRIRCYDQAQNWEVFGSGSAGMWTTITLNANSNTRFYAQTLQLYEDIGGLFDMYCQVRLNGSGTWVDLGLIVGSLQYWSF